MSAYNFHIVWYEISTYVYAIFPYFFCLYPLVSLVKRSLYVALPSSYITLYINVNLTTITYSSELYEHTKFQGRILNTALVSLAPQKFDLYIYIVNG